MSLRSLLLMTAAALAISARAVAAPPATSKPSTAPAAAQTCLATAADLTPVYPTTSFPAGTKELCVTIPLDKGAGIGRVTSTWIAVDVGDVAPANYKIATAELETTGSDRAKFKYSQPKAMPPGKYHVDLTADGKPLASADFTVQETAKTTNVKQPEDLLPLKKGLVWTFDFTQESGGDAKIVLEDVSPSPDGKFRATVTQTVAGEDAQGAHIELRRNDKLVFHEWWTLDKAGLAATQRKSGDEPGVVLDPPQVLWSWPLRPSKTWNYRPRDRSYAQTYRMWGPLPVDSPAGAVPGYVVLCEQKNDGTTITAERHWIPGVGLGKEIIITALNDHMISRQELKLTGSGAK